jgi:hypothetical protein
MGAQTLFRNCAARKERNSARRLHQVRFRRRDVHMTRDMWILVGGLLIVVILALSGIIRHPDHQDLGAAARQYRR